MSSGWTIEQFVRPERGVRCRMCDAGEPNSAEVSPVRCYLGETTWPNGERRAVVVFECTRCNALRYNDLATELPLAYRLPDRTPRDPARELIAAMGVPASMLGGTGEIREAWAELKQVAGRVDTTPTGGRPLESLQTIAPQTGDQPHAHAVETPPKGG